MAVSSTEQSEATRIQKLEKFLNRELRGSTLTNYTLKADIRAHRKAEKINKVSAIRSLHLFLLAGVGASGPYGPVVYPLPVSFK